MPFVRIARIIDVLSERGSGELLLETMFDGRFEGSLKEDTINGINPMSR